MSFLDILGELEVKGKLKNIRIGGYLTRRLERPPIFKSEILEENCKFVEIKIVYATNDKGKRVLSKGKVVAFVSNEVEEKDFYEFRGTLSLAGLNYSRVVTMMNFKKKSYNNEKGFVWGIVPVSVEDLEITKLNNQVYREVMIFSESPLSYEYEKYKYVLEPLSEVTDTSKVYYDFTSVHKAKKVRQRPIRDVSEFEESYKYLIDREYLILNEGLQYNKLILNITDFKNDEMLLRFAEWMMNFRLEVVSTIEELDQEQEMAIMLSDRQIDGYPYIELKKGVFKLWDL